MKRRRRKKRTSSGSNSDSDEPVKWSSNFSLLSSGNGRVKKRKPGSDFDSGPGPNFISGLVEPGLWSSIPGDILSVIATKFGSIVDYVRFCAVCRSWYSLATGLYDLNRSLRFGPLLLTSGSNSKSMRVTLGNPSSNGTFELDLPVAPKTLRWGSPFGWLVSYVPADHRFGLLNPFTGATILLPRPGSGPLDPDWARSRDPLIKAILTADPESDPINSLLVVSSKVSGDFSLVRPGAPGLIREWSHIKGVGNLDDVKGKLYGIQYHEIQYRSPEHLRIVLFEEINGQISHSLVKTLTLDTTPFQGSWYKCFSHIVEIDGELFLCLRYNSHYASRPPVFKIFKIDLPNGNFTQVYSLADRCLFLGDTYSFSCKASYSQGDFFERPEHDPCEFASNYVFYKYSDRRLGIDVWDVSRSEMAWKKRQWIKGSSPPLWIVPFIKFRKLEE